jgi:hypothetical protein
MLIEAMVSAALRSIDIRFVNMARTRHSNSSDLTMLTAVFGWSVIAVAMGSSVYIPLPAERESLVARSYRRSMTLASPVIAPLTFGIDFAQEAERFARFARICRDSMTHNIAITLRQHFYVGEHDLI